MQPSTWGEAGRSGARATLSGARAGRAAAGGAAVARAGLERVEAGRPAEQAPEVGELAGDHGAKDRVDVGARLVVQLGIAREKEAARRMVEDEAQEVGEGDRP